VRAHPTAVSLANKKRAWIKPTWEPVWPHVHVCVCVFVYVSC